MAGLRWRAPTALAFFRVFALCFSLQQPPPLSAKDAPSAKEKAKSEKAASTAEESSDSSAASRDAPTTDGKSAKKKSKNSAGKKKELKRGKPRADDSGDSSVPAPPGGSSR